MACQTNGDRQPGGGAIVEDPSTDCQYRIQQCKDMPACGSSFENTSKARFSTVDGMSRMSALTQTGMSSISMQASVQTGDDRQEERTWGSLGPQDRRALPLLCDVHAPRLHSGPCMSCRALSQRRVFASCAYGAVPWKLARLVLKFDNMTKDSTASQQLCPLATKDGTPLAGRSVLYGKGCGIFS